MGKPKRPAKERRTQPTPNFARKKKGFQEKRGFPLEKLNPKAPGKPGKEKPPPLI